ncbi:MAG: phosphoenolpyruvate carboxylase, partial [Planctomycetales bacterium]|nr:phosphoenolpyruvate carboxylase [Planctomycetales bacterium]
MAVDETLRGEITLLGNLFGDVIKRHAGQHAFDLVEKVRAEARDFRDGDVSMGDQLAELLSGLSAEELRVVIQAFSGFLELANLAEDRQRVRAIRERERSRFPQPRKESAQAAILELASQGFSPEQVSAALARVDIELVFTAHPTEAKRKSLRAKLRRMRALMERRDQHDLLPKEQERLDLRLESELAKLWQTDLVRASAPTVLEEVQRGLSFQEVLWATVPQVMSDTRAALHDAYPAAGIAPARLIRFGSWMGGDRDGNPFVTPEFTEQTCLWLRRAALEAHEAIGERLVESISISCGATPECRALRSAVQEALDACPGVERLIERLAPDETYRRWLKIITWRLRQTGKMSLLEDIPHGAYRSVDQLLADVKLVRDSLLATGNQAIVETDVQPWLDQINAFGFQTARLDIRQHSGVYREVMEEIWRSANLISEADLPLSEERRVQLLRQTLPVAANLSPVNRTETTRQTLDLFRLLRRIARRFGMASLGAHVISMTNHPSDLLTVLWLWKWSERADARNREYNVDADASLCLPISPLFETIDDLHAGAEILIAALAVPEYRAYVKSQGDEQMVMVGYSDSTKDGGYLAAQWALHRSQLQVFQTAKQRGVHVTFFHGRGGSLGRGGGPANSAILAQPPHSVDGRFKLTEQGEVIFARYGNPVLAIRHVESVAAATLLQSAPSVEKRNTEMTEKYADMAAQLDEAAHNRFLDL